MNSFLKAISLFIVFTTTVTFGQMQQVIHDVDFATSTPQNMWGPSWSPFSIDQEITLFNVPWNVSANESAIATIVGQSFGFGFSGGFSGVIGSKVSLEGFTTGTVEVDYPIEVTLDMNADYTYDQGDQVVIETSYDLRNGAEIVTNYPSAGEFKWDIYFQMAANASATLCFFGCTTFPIIPSFNTGLQTINMATVSGNGASTGGITGAWFLGPADFSNPFNQQPGIGGWPYAWPPQTSPTNTPLNWIPWQCHVPAFPVNVDTPFGLTGELTIPYVETTSGPSPSNPLYLQACGDSSYLNINLEIFKLLGAILNISPPPGPAIGQVLSNLSGSVELGPAEISWNLFSASFDATIFNRQCFDFEPIVWGRFQFPVPVEYQIYDPGSGSLSATATSTIVNVELGKHLRYKFPCYFDELEINPKYYIDGTTPNFTNHTWDDIEFNFLMSAFEFGIQVPSVVIIPGFTIPEICIDIPYPCPTWSNPFKICWTTACTPEIVVPPVVFGGVDVSYGPLWSTSIPLGTISYDWFNQSWNLEGFSQVTKPPFKMRASQLSISNTHVDILCHGDATGSIDVVDESATAISPALPYTYTWTNGATTQDLTGLTAGPYEVSVFDANGCQMFTGATIIEPTQPLMVSSTQINKSCNGGVDDGSINLLIQGGTAPYSTVWSNAATTANISGLAAGTYTATVTDSKGCQEVISVTITEPNTLGQVAAITHVLCNGGTDGEVAVDVFGGTQPYSYNWDSGQTTEDIYNVSAGNYQLTVTDAKGCTSVNTYGVNEPLAPITLAITGVDILCKGASTGSVDLTVNGGTPGYSFQWSNAQSIILPYQTEDLTNIPADNYTVLVTDVNGCTETISQLLTQPLTSVTSNPTFTHVNCFGDATGVINSGISGGTPGYVYNWSNGSSVGVNNGLTAGTYTLDVTDNNGCLSSYSYTITEPTQLVISTTGVDVLCFGEATGETTVTASGGTSPYSYLWSNGVTTTVNSNVVAGNYDVTVTDAVGCIETTTQAITQPAAPLSVSFITTDVSCFGGSNGAIDMTASNGTGPYNYIWSTSGSVIIVDTTEDVSGLPADDYLLTITDDHGCVLNSSVSVNQPASPISLNAIETDILCLGGNNGAIDLTVTGGTTGYTYLWSSGTTAEDLNTLFAGTYNVTVTDANGCVESATYNLTEPATAVTISLELHDVNCNGGADGYILSETSGGVGPYTYLWSNGATTPNISWLTAGAYSVTVTDANGCTSFTGGVIKEPATTISISYATVEVSCFGGNDGVIGIGATGGVEPYYYSWGNQNLILLSAQNTIIDQLTAGDYLIHVEDANGCYSEETITVVEPTLLESSYTSVDILCNGDETGSIDVTTWGGSVPYTYVWSNGEITEDISNLGAGWYFYEITDANGCRTNDSVQITQPYGFWSSFAQTGLSCVDQSDAYIGVEVGGGVPPYVYMWNTGEDSYEIFDLSAGNYTLIFTDANGCSDTLDFIIDPVYNSCIDVPNTFTPNGDDYNDTWFIENLELYPNAEVMIFNKWGNQLYKNDGVYEPWDGTVNGQPLPSEVYYYIILLNNNQGDKYTGVVTIIR